MSTFLINNSPNLNLSFKGTSYSYNNIFNVQNYKAMGNISNTFNQQINQNDPYLLKNNSSFFYINNNYYNIANNNYNHNFINNTNDYVKNNNNNNYYNHNFINNTNDYAKNNNNNNNNIIINQIYAKNNQMPSQNINYIYQNNSLSPKA